MSITHIFSHSSILTVSFSSGSKHLRTERFRTTDIKYRINLVVIKSHVIILILVRFLRHAKGCMCCTIISLSMLIAKKYDISFHFNRKVLEGFIEFLCKR